ncbi:adventurous gliding motility lipoprotein CglC [Corallococcus exiguus]|uniref:Adventurous gliding motility lipoprotein CglC n=1 Tax=Corallococcus exiguus TaxID=83462 RepID=A0A7X4YCF3_9BACT|nr:adventurous gliding motility lipoprotein CglC [Corallococcus exiguus]NBC42909.1 adventurous gliding motility lipoprotein CglC [Corallococcus exiguus]NNC21938.1 adventurous gliding motility lipoprotein CglC [Corallococcus exiguus]TNV54882.1 adventurous gliding motility lipoprotein CglC [Corallococcus exiguus]
MFVRTALFLSAALMLGGCDVTTELGKPCQLVRRATDQEREEQGRKFVEIQEKDIAVDQDFISFGSLDCEDLVCVRDDQSPRSDNPEAFALGYCSKECVQGTTTGCEITRTVDDVEPGLKERMTCRPLLLDQDTLDAIKISDESFYRRTFGENNSPYFCAGAVPAAQGN